MIRLIKIILIIVIAIAAVFAIYTLVSAPSANQTNTSPALSEEDEIKQFITQYLAAYQNVNKNQNYEEVMRFLADEVIVQMQRENMPFQTNAADFDGFKILKIEKTNHEPYAPQITGWKATVQLSMGAEALADETPITVIKENGGWKTTSWYFAP